MISVLVRVVGSQGDSRSWTKEEAMVSAMEKRCLRSMSPKQRPSIICWRVMAV